MNALQKLKVCLISCLAVGAMFASAGAADTTTSAEAPAEYVSQQLARLDFSTMPDWQKSAVIEASNYAYMDLNKARSSAQKEEILQARNTIIYSQGWVADDLEGYVSDQNGNIVEEVLPFHELFPADWEIPKVETNSNKESAIAPLAWELWLSQKEVYLKVPKAGTNAEPFYEMETSGFKGTPAEYYVSRIMTNGTFVENMAAGYYNLGYANAKTGESYGWKANILSGYSYTQSVKRDVCVAIRASTYSHIGSWAMTVMGDRYDA